MTVSSNVSTALYSGNGVTTIFPIPFYFLTNGDVLVQKLTAATGIVSTLVLNSDYTLTGAGVEAGGSLIMSAAPLAGDRIYVSRDVDAVQETAYPSNSPFPASSHEMALDRLTMIVQQDRAQLALALQRSPLANSVNLSGSTLVGSGNAVNPTDVPNLGQVQAAIIAGAAPALALPSGSSNVGFQQAGTGAIARTVQKKLQEGNSVEDFGADNTGVANSASGFANTPSGDIYVPAGSYTFTSSPALPAGSTFCLSTNVAFTGSNASSLNDIKFYGTAPTTGTWVKPIFSGDFEYLKSDATFAVAEHNGIGVFSSAHTNHASNVAASSALAFAALAYNDYPSGSGGTWCYYGTTINSATATGSTIGLELDVANVNSAVPIYPASMFPAGLTAAAWLASGGETANQAGTAKTASAAIGIISNDPNGVANFNKGIVFHNKSISGATGASGTGCAVAFATGHQTLWFNNSGAVAGELVCDNFPATNPQRLDFSQFGLLVQDRASGGTQFEVVGVANSANYLQVLPTASGGGAISLYAIGSDANISIALTPKGSGLLKFGTYTAGTITPTGYIQILTSDGITRKIPCL